MNNIFFNDIYRNKKVLITGHTGFKGVWLSLWLKKMGADVYGFSLENNTNPNHFSIIKPEIKSLYGDVGDYNFLKKCIEEVNPDIIFHMAAQALVKDGYSDPVYTYNTNVMGTVNLFDISRNIDNLKAIINVTSDKCYENREWVWGYRENDPMGGFDPYSSSKGCSELVTSSFRNSFFNLNDYGVKHNVLIASCRAGNVIGGGDWADYRIIPDIVMAYEKKQTLLIRCPDATRPWEYVLEPLSGYLVVGQKLLEGKKEYADSWNFGPDDSSIITVSQLLEEFRKHWGDIDYKLGDEKFHEASLLKLDCSKASQKLNWKPVFDFNNTVSQTALWYKDFYKNNNVDSFKYMEYYLNKAVDRKMSWIS